MKYLAYTDITELPEDEKSAFAFNFIVSSLVGKHSHNFGEIVNFIV